MWIFQHIAMRLKIKAMGGKSHEIGRRITCKNGEQTQRLLPICFQPGGRRI
jgi:hypothetical protein